MEYFPTPRGLSRSVAYAAVGGIIGPGVIAILLGPLLTLTQFVLAETAIFVAVGFFLLRQIMLGKKYGYDRKGVYKEGKLVFGWNEVDKIALKFKESEGSVTLVARPTWSAVISGPMVEKAEWVSYGASIVFSLANGSVISIASNLDRLADDGVIQKVDDIARDANPAIKFE